MSTNSGYDSMPSSPASWPKRSTWCVTRALRVMSMSFHSANETANTNTPIASTPISWTWNCAPPATPMDGRQRSPDAGEEVGGHGSDDVVELDLLQQLEAGDADHAADCADDHGPVVVGEVRGGGDGDEARYRAVESGEEVRASEEGP